MTVHCRKQHNFDPFPSYTTATPSTATRKTLIATTQSNNRPSEGLFVAAGRLANMIDDWLKYKKLETGRGPTRRQLENTKTPAKAIDYMLRNFVLIRKSKINGISGHICNHCLTFQFEYIKDMGHDFTAKEKHLCMSGRRINQFNSPHDRVAKWNQIYTESIQHLIGLTNSIFTGDKCIVAERVSNAKSATIHAPIFNLNLLSSAHWAWLAIQSGEPTTLSDGTLQTIIEEIRGTYAILVIQMGDLAGHYIVYLSGMNRFL